MREGYQTFDLVWKERAIEISYQANWLNSGQWHIELRSETPLPVTQTGYRSQFVSGVKFADDAAVAAYVIAWLDEAAGDPKWQRYLQDSRQLTLF